MKFSSAYEAKLLCVARAHEGDTEARTDYIGRTVAESLTILKAISSGPRNPVAPGTWYLIAPG